MIASIKSKYMKKILTIICGIIIALMLTQCKSLLTLPTYSKKYSPEESIKILERVLNLQYKHTPTNVYVDRDCYKVTYAKTNFIVAGGSTIPSTSMKHKFIYYRDIDSFKLYQYPNCYNLVIYNKKGREINKVISKNLYDLQEVIFAIRSLQ